MTEQLRDIILHDHFGGEMSEHIVDQWVQALEPGSRVPLPPSVRGFYGGSLRASMPIEISRGSYKYIAHETEDGEKIAKYARRMLVALALIDVDSLASTEPTLAALALWHTALAQVRLPDETASLRKTLEQYVQARSRSNLPDSKLPQPPRLAESLASVAKSLGNDRAQNSIDALLEQAQNREVI
jgi:hypothetical protein